MPVIESASNFTDARLYEIHGNAIINHLTDTNDSDEAKKIQSIVNLPRAQASHKDYETKKKSGPCFPGTRAALLREMTNWITDLGESRMYVLSGLAGIGKSTVVYTLATQAAELGLLGASFFFSRDEADRRNAKKFFTTIAFQLCVYNETFSKAIGDVLLTKCGAAATTQDPQTQLRILLLDPLRSIVQSRARPILVVVDALDECDEEDEPAVVMGLGQLVRLLPSFKVILTTRPQPLVNYLFDNHDGHKIFRLQDIEDKVVDSDIRLYLSHSFSQEQVRARLLNPKIKWCASDVDIDSLVNAAGRLFIIASTAVRYVLNKALGDPSARMKRLLGEIAQDRTPFHALNHFYSVIVRSAVQVDGDNDDNDDIPDKYRIIVGTIVVIQTPLPVTTLTCFVGEESENIYAMLRNLQSVILLGNDDIPHIYNKSFPEYLTDQARCRDPRLRIDPKIRHTQIAICCFEIMDKRLKLNILGLGDPARFMNNGDGLKKDGITEEQLEERIPQQLRYACVYWASHFKVVNIEDAYLLNKLQKFVDEHILHWFEVLSLIGKLDSAHGAIRVALTLLKSQTSSDLHQLLSDALRFISKFYEPIERSAFHTYCSALPFTPTDSPLYRRYIKAAGHNICGIEGGLENWDALIANQSHQERVSVIEFSLDSTLFVSYSVNDDYYETEGKLKIWDAATGAPISTIPGYMFAVANNFSTVVSSKDNIITYYNVNGSAKGTILATSSMIEKLALSSETSRVAAALSDGTVWLWDSSNAKLIDRFDAFGGSGQLEFSPSGTRLAYSSEYSIELRDGNNGRFIANLRCGPSPMFGFSGDGSRIASISCDKGVIDSMINSLTLWNSESGGCRAVRSVGVVHRQWLAISANGSLLATATTIEGVTLWRGSNDSLAQIEVLKIKDPQSMAFSSNNILAIATRSNVVRLYDVKTHSFISTLPPCRDAVALAFSPDYSHLAVGSSHGSVYLCNIGGIDPCNPPSREGVSSSCVTALALSRDCLRLVCGFKDDTVELWVTNPTKRRIASYQAHTESVKALGFSPGRSLLASGSDDATIKLWNGGALRGILRVPHHSLLAVALSNRMIVVGFIECVTLWSLDTLSLIHTFRDIAGSVSIAENSGLIAAAYTIHSPFLSHRVSLLDVVTHTTVAAFNIPIYDTIHTMTFLPDNSQLVIQNDEGDFLSYNLIKHTIEALALEHLTQLPNIPLWYGIPVWYCRENDQDYCSALFSRHRSPVPVLFMPRNLHVTTWTQGLSMIALGCQDGRIMLVRLPTGRLTRSITGTMRTWH